MTGKALLCVAVVALVVRVSFALALAADHGSTGTLSRHLLGDERAYDAFARQVADDGLPRTRAFYQAPAYAWLLGQVYRVWPPPPVSDEDTVVAVAPVHRALFATQHLFGIATAVLTALLADRTGWRVVEGEAARRTTRPVGEVGRGIVGGRIAAAFGPDVS